MISTLLTLYSTAFTVATRWPDPNKDELVFVKNPIEAEMPGHWVPLSIIKVILEKKQQTTPRMVNKTNFPLNKKLKTKKPDWKDGWKSDWTGEGEDIDKDVWEGVQDGGGKDDWEGAEYNGGKDKWKKPGRTKAPNEKRTKKTPNRRPPYSHKSADENESENGTHTNDDWPSPYEDSYNGTYENDAKNSQTETNTNYENNASGGNHANGKHGKNNANNDNYESGDYYTKNTHPTEVNDATNDDVDDGDYQNDNSNEMNMNSAISNEANSKPKGGSSEIGSGGKNDVDENVQTDTNSNVSIESVQTKPNKKGKKKRHKDSHGSVPG